MMGVPATPSGSRAPHEADKSSSPEASIPNADEYDFDYEDDECWNCGGDGFVSNCFTEYACIYPDEGCDECTRRCDVCRPSRPNATPEGDAQ